MKIPVIASTLLLSLSFVSAGDWEAGPLFNGKNLEGWEGLEDAWEVRARSESGNRTSSGEGKGGEIWCTGTAVEKNWLIWRGGQPDNFVLQLEFLWKSGNSGVQVRSDDLGDHQVFGYQVEVARQAIMGLWHHSLLPRDHPRREERHLMATAGQAVMIAENGSKTVEQIADPEEIKKHYREKEWNKMEIVVDGDTIVQKINGVVFSTVTDKDTDMSREKGFIALQDHGKGCVVAFRDILLKELP